MEVYGLFSSQQLKVVQTMNTVLVQLLQFIHDRMLLLGAVLLFMFILAVFFAVSLVKAQQKLHQSYTNVLYTLALSLEARDPYSAGHSMRVAALSKHIGEMMGLSSEELETINRAGLLHDIGKIGIRDSELLKGGRLNEEETEKMKQHPLIAVSLLRSVDKYYQQEIAIIEAHHERWDGSGYPRNLKGTEIALGARILAVADSFDALTSDRPYRQALPSKLPWQKSRRMQVISLIPGL